MGGNAQGFAPPVGQPVKGADAEPAEPGVVRALRRFEPPVKAAFRSGRVQVIVNGAVVGFLINDEAIGAGGDQVAILRSFHRPHFEGDAGKFRVQRADAIGEVAVGDESRMFAGDQQ